MALTLFDSSMGCYIDGDALWFGGGGLLLLFELVRVLWWKVELRRLPGVLSTEA